MRGRGRPKLPTLVRRTQKRLTSPPSKFESVPGHMEAPCHLGRYPKLHKIYKVFESNDKFQ